MWNHKEEYDYFDGFLHSAQSASEEAAYLCAALESFDAEKVPEHAANMHKIENDADMQKHELTSHLAREFMTPIEREDIAELSRELDTLIDSVEDVMRRIYMFGVTELRPEAIEFARLIVRCCDTVEKLVKEFRSFKKSKEICNFIIEVNTLESTGDKLHADSMRRLFCGNEEPRTLIVWQNLFEALENCLDACEHTADVIEGVVMKNT